MRKVAPLDVESQVGELGRESQELRDSNVLEVAVKKIRFAQGEVPSSIVGKGVELRVEHDWLMIGFKRMKATYFATYGEPHEPPIPGMEDVTPPKVPLEKKKFFFQSSACNKTSGAKLISVQKVQIVHKLMTA